MADQLRVPSPDEIRGSILRVDRTALIVRGVANPNVTKDSDYWIRAESLAQHLAPLYANQQVRADQTMPDTAVGPDLTRILAIFELQPRGAQGSTGPAILDTSNATFIPTTQQLIDSNGQVWQVTVGATYNNGDNIPIAAISTGAGTNHPQGTALQWVSSPAYANPKALVGVGGLIGGADADVDETSRNRLLTYFRNPPQGGNWSQVKGWGEAASASVQACYVYPALNGPGTFGVCVLGPLTFDGTNGWTRQVSSTTLNIVQAYLEAFMPEHSKVTIVTPTDVGGSSPDIDTSTSIGMSLPLSTIGGGPGGGWVDATPWPELEGASPSTITASRVYLSAKTSDTSFTLTSNDPTYCPSSTHLVVGETQIGWFSQAAYAAGNPPIVTAVVTAVSGTTGALVVTISKPFPNIAVGDFIMPVSENIQAYALAYLTSMNDMGPGQWTSNAQVLVRGSRRPLVAVSNPSDFTGTLLRALSSVGDEVLDVDYLYRSVTTPTIPANTTVASPLVLVPFRFGFFNRIP